MKKWKNGKSPTYPDPELGVARFSCWGFATITVVVANHPLLSVEVLQRVTSGAVTTCFDPFESVDVEKTGFGRVDVGCVVIVLVAPVVFP